MQEQQIPSLIYQLQVKHSVKLLQSLINKFRGDQSMISFEGDLSYLDTRGLQIVSQEPKGILTQNSNPKIGKVILLLNSASIDYFERNIMYRAGIRSRIWHIMISISNRLVFASYDSFHEDCVWITAEVGTKWLDDLVEAKIIRNYELMEGA